MSDNHSNPETLLLAIGVLTCLRADAHIAVTQVTAELPEFWQFEFSANRELIIEENHQFLATAVTDTVLTHQGVPICELHIHNSLVKIAREVYAKRPKEKIPEVIYEQLRGNFTAGQQVLEYAYQLQNMLRAGQRILPVICAVIDQTNAKLPEPITLDGLPIYLWSIVRSTCSCLPAAKGVFLLHYTEATSLAIQLMLNSFKSSGFKISHSARLIAQQNIARRLGRHILEQLHV